MNLAKSKLSTFSLLLLIFAILLSAKPASADIVWDWSYKCSTGEKCKGGGGTFTTGDEQGSGINAYYTISALTGTVEGNAITELLAPNSLGEDNDNKVDTFGSPWPNDGHKITGIAFLTNNSAPTSTNVNLLFSNFIDDFVGYYTQIQGSNFTSLLDVDYSAKKTSMAEDPAAVPEPNSLILLGTVALCSLTIKFRRKSFTG